MLELGLAIGALGRRNVSLLYEDGVELPSDYYGVVYTAFDAGGGWNLALVGELKAAGFPVDANMTGQGEGFGSNRGRYVSHPQVWWHPVVGTGPLTLRRSPIT